MFRSSFLLFFGLVLASLPFRAGAEQMYLLHLSDVPLIPKGVEIEDQSVVFDKAEGRVVMESVLVEGDAADVPSVHRFYQDSLPPLGWKALGFGRFVRNGEQLVVKAEKVSKGVLITFALSPEQD